MEAFLTLFFTNLGIRLESIEVSVEGENLNITIKTPDSALLIGQHGKNMDALKHLIARIAEKQLSRFIHVHLEVNDYMKAKDERLFRFLESKIEFAMTTGKSIRMPNLSSFERKKAHNYVAEKHIEGLSTKSEGEGNERVLTLVYTGPIKEKSHTNTPHKNTHHESDLTLLSEDGVGI